MTFKQTIATAVLAGYAALGHQAYATNIVVNGSFENGNTGFSSGYVLGDGSASSLYPEGKYQIGTNPHNFHDGFVSISAQDGSNMMVVNGAPAAGVPVWSESGLTITPDTLYYFSTWVASVSPEAPANLQFSINGTTVGTLQATSSSNWQQFYTTWNSGNATTASISLVNLNTAAGGNDFALDDIAFDTVAPTSAVPEPASIALVGMGLLGLTIRRRKT